MVFDEYFKDRMIHSVVLNMFLLKSINFQNHSSSLLWFQALFLQNIKVKQSALNWNLQYKRKRPLVRALYNIGLNHTITGHQLTATITGLNYRTMRIEIRHILIKSKPGYKTSLDPRNPPKDSP